MAYILNIETSTDICSVCIAKGETIVSIRETERSYSHSEVIATFIKECLVEASMEPSDLDAIAVSRGPGSYTALRIGTATAKGMCFALDIPLISIDTLTALANSVHKEVGDNEIIIPMIDARRKEVYHAHYDKAMNILKEVEPIILDETTYAALSSSNKIWILGDGAPKSRDILSIHNAHFVDIECSSKYMVSLSLEKFEKKEFEDIAYYEPNYYKGANITVQKKNILR